MIMQVQGFKFHQIHLALYDLNVDDLIYDLNLRYSIFRLKIVILLTW